MFCRSLRTRLDLHDLIPEFVNSTDPKMRESKITTYDAAFAVPSNAPVQTATLRLLILTSDAVDANAKASTIARIEHFSALTGGDNIAIAFILSHNGSQVHPTDSGLHAFLKLQLFLQTHPSLPPLPILPIPDSAGFLPSIQTYIDSVKLYSNLPAPKVPTRRALLPHLTSSAPSHPLTEHDANVLSDICRSVSDVAALSETDQGRAALRDWLGEAGIGVAEFWEDEREV